MKAAFVRAWPVLRIVAALAGIVTLIPIFGLAFAPTGVGVLDVLAAIGLVWLAGAVVLLVAGVTLRAMARG